MWRCPPASGTPFITRPRAKKKPRGPTEESRPKQNLLVYPRTPPHRQVDAILPAASSTLERASELIDAKVPDLFLFPDDVLRYGNHHRVRRRGRTHEIRWLLRLRGDPVDTDLPAGRSLDLGRRRPRRAHRRAGRPRLHRFR